MLALIFESYRNVVSFFGTEPRTLKRYPTDPPIEMSNESDSLSERSTVLVTGGAGFIGSSIATELAVEREVTVLDSLVGSDTGRVPTNAEFINGDIRDPETVDTVAAGTDCLFHQAALVSVDASVDDPMESHAINATGTLNILKAARTHNSRVVLASSAAIYGHPETTPIPESHRTKPTSPYGLDKLACDHYARLYHDLYDLDTVALRYFNVYGPGQIGGDYAGVISVFLEQALNDDPVTVHGTGEQTRDFVFVDDVVRANLLAAETDHVGEAYNVGTGESISIRELAELIVDITDSDSDIVHTEARTGDIEHSKADISKAESKLGYEPTVSIEEGLERTVEWFRTQ